MNAPYLNMALIVALNRVISVQQLSPEYKPDTDLKKKIRLKHLFCT